MTGAEEKEFIFNMAEDIDFACVEEAIKYSDREEIAKVLYGLGYRKVVWYDVHDKLPRPNSTYQPVRIAYQLSNGLVINGIACYYYYSREWSIIELNSDVKNYEPINPENIIAWADLPEYEE